MILIGKAVPTFPDHALNSGRENCAMFDDDAPRKKIAHEIGQDLALLSVEELQERVALLAGEIARLEEAAASKRASLSAASAFFKKG
jgi:uncharacterized small protein (DUF1192 family)